MGIEPTEEVKRLNKAFESGFLKVGMKEALDISLITGNVISEMLMMGQGAKQYGFKEPGLTEYLVKASAAFIGGTPAQLGYGLLPVAQQAQHLNTRLLSLAAHFLMVITLTQFQ